MATKLTNQYNTMTFGQIWKDSTDFKNDYASCPLAGAITTDSQETLFYLLYGRHGNDPIANQSVNQFKAKVFSIIFQYGPAWEKRLAIQKDLTTMTADEIQSGSKSISNHASNPSSAPGTEQQLEIPFVDAQDVSHIKRGKLEGYSLLLDLLKTDVTEEFLRQFQHCFKAFVRPEKTLLFVDYEEEEEEEEND